jgi:hypothetical protein
MLLVSRFLLSYPCYLMAFTHEHEKLNLKEE